MGKGTCPSSTIITCTAVPEPCPSNSNNTCLQVTVSYNYASSPLFPEMPGLGVITPSTISSTNVLQMSNPSSLDASPSPAPPRLVPRSPA